MSLDGGTEQMRWALSVAPNIGSPAFRVLIGLLTYRNRESGTAWPASATLGVRCGMSTSAVDKALRSLRDAGVIEIVGTRKASAGWGTKEYTFSLQPLSVSIEPQPLSVSIEPDPQPLSKVTEPSTQVLSEVTEPQPLSEVTEPMPASVEIEAQPLSESTDKPLEEPQIQLPPPTTTSPVEEWTGPSEQDLTWLAGQVSTKVEGCAIDLDSITEKMLKARKPQMTSGGWMMAALALLHEWPSKEQAASTFTDTPVAGEGRPRVRESEWHPSPESYREMLPDFPLIRDKNVIHEITRLCIDHYAKQGLEMANLRTPEGAWKTFVRNNYEEAIRGHISLRNPQMTGTE